MTVAALLAGYAALLGALGSRLLRDARWMQRAPRLAIGVWQAAAASVLGSVALAGLSLTVSAARVGGGIASLLHACADALRHHYATPAQPFGGLLGAALTVIVLAWTAAHIATAVFAGYRRRRAHRDALTLLARRDPALGADVIEHEQPAAYCLPGRDRRVVVTQAAIDRLTAAQLAAVLAHERAHVDGRHHLVLAAAHGLATAFGFVPLFRALPAALAHLVELAADDAAARRQDRRTVAAALIAVAAGPVPAAAFGASSSHALARIRRLLAQPAPLTRRARAAWGAVAAALLLVPVLVAADPAIMSIIDHHCPILH